MIFPKKSHWNMIFLVSSGKMAFLFLENMIFFLQTENERWSFSKNTWKYIFRLFGKDGISFSYKHEITLREKSKDDLLPIKTLKDDIFSITEKDDSHPRKDDIGILDWHSRKSSNDSLYLYGDLFRCFGVLLSNERNQKT